MRSFVSETFNFVSNCHYSNKLPPLLPQRDNCSKADIMKKPKFRITVDIWYTSCSDEVHSHAQCDVFISPTTFVARDAIKLTVAPVTERWSILVDLRWTYSANIRSSRASLRYIRFGQYSIEELRWISNFAALRSISEAVYDAMND